jgi:predicted ester cyclase
MISSTSPTSALKAHYLSYINALNTRQHLSPGLSSYVHSQVTYNSNPISLENYQSIIDDSVSAIPDLYYDVDESLLIAQSDANDTEELTGFIAARINFNCTPTKEFFGFKPRDDGKKIVFSENVFYRFEDGRIREVWSVIDKEEFGKQMKSFWGAWRCDVYT